jgi:hypothetical protein
MLATHIWETAFKVCFQHQLAPLNRGLELRHVLFKSAFFVRFSNLTKLDVSGARQGLTLVHISAQSNHLLWDPLWFQCSSDNEF